VLAITRGLRRRSQDRGPRTVPRLFDLDIVLPELLITVQSSRSANGCRRLGEILTPLALEPARAAVLEAAYEQGYRSVCHRG